MFNRFCAGIAVAMILTACGGGSSTNDPTGSPIITARDTGRGWVAVASSQDGSRLVAAVMGGQLYTSTDSGVTWTVRESVKNWQAVASSADGSKLVAATNSGNIYTSVDYGVSWTSRDTSRPWISVASSSDGSKLRGGSYRWFALWLHGFRRKLAWGGWDGQILDVGRLFD